MATGKRSIVRKNDVLLREYLEFLREHQCVAEATIVIRRHFVSPFLEYIGEIAVPSRIHRLTAKIVHDYIIATTPPLTRASKKHVTSSIRSFLRFLHIRGFLKRDLVQAVPVITTRKLDRLPRGIPWKSVEKLLCAPDRRTHSGRRDFAILLLLARYGVRIGQVTTLRLENIRWKENVIHFSPSKGGNALRLPLEDDVAHALLSYIGKDRGRHNFKEVFLTLWEPRRPLGLQNHFWQVLEKYYRRAGLPDKVRGSRAIRHAFATRLMEKKVPIKAIADLLGHRWIDTTFIYTKVDVPQLRLLARDWPGSCK